MKKTNLFAFKFGLIIAISTLCYSNSFGQSQDANLWLGASIKYDLNKLTRFSFDEEFRFHENFSKLEQNHTEFGIDRELSNRWDAGVYYRFIYEKDVARDYSLGHRGWLQIEYVLIDSDIEVSLRTRFQGTVKNVQSSVNGKNPEWYNRYKMGIEYKPKKAVWVPNGGIEFWHFLNPGGSPFFDKYRMSFGLEYRYSKSMRFEIFYSYQSQIQVSNPNIDHIFGLSCSYYIN